MSDPRASRFTAKWLMEQDFPPPVFVLPGLIPQGCTLLVAPPKLGKSWFCLSLGVAVSTGTEALGGVPVQQRPVLYMALEDGQITLQDRLRTLGAVDLPETLEFIDTIPEDTIGTVRAFLEDYADQEPLVILDTLGKVKGVYAGNDAYGNDYAIMSTLKARVDDVPGASLIVVHHTNKGGRTDFVDSVSGTQGIAGAADTILTIQRERFDNEAVLKVTSRLMREAEAALTLHDGVRWELDGDSLAEASQRVAKREAEQGLGEDMRGILEGLEQHPEGISPADLAEQLEMDAGKVRTYLRRLADQRRALNPHRGLYTPVSSVTSVISPSQSGVDESNSVTPGVTLPGLTGQENNKVTDVTPSPGAVTSLTNGTDPDLQTVLELMPIDTPTLTKRTGWGVQKSALLIQKARKMEATR